MSIVDSVRQVTDLSVSTPYKTLIYRSKHPAVSTSRAPRHLRRGNGVPAPKLFSVTLLQWSHGPSAVVMRPMLRLWPAEYDAAIEPQLQPW